MDVPVVIGSDVGTQSVKTGLFDVTGRCLAEASAEIPLHRLAADHVEQEPADFLGAVTSTIADCVAKSACSPADVAGLAIAGQMAGILGIGQGGEAVTPYDSWLDCRCRPELERIAGRLGAQMVARTGCPPMVDHAPKMAWWRNHQAATYSRLAKFVVPSAFVAGQLCGLGADEAFVDWTYLHFTGIAEAETGEWSAELAEAAGVELSRAPRIVAPTDRVGALTPAAAARCGLLAGTPVAAGLGDTAAGALGAGTVRPGHVLDTAGTASVLAVSTERFSPDSTGTLIAMRGALRGQWICLSYLAGGDLLAWLPRAVGGSSLAELIEEAAAAPPARLLFVPHLGGRILPADASLRGAWVGLDLSQGRGDLVRAVLESIAYEYSGFLDRARELYPELAPEEVKVIGGGSQDTFWNQVKSSALGLPYATLRKENFSCWGAALVAASAVGAVGDLAAAALAARTGSDRTEPLPALSSVYLRRKTDYRALLEILREKRDD